MFLLLILLLISPNFAIFLDRHDNDCDVDVDDYYNVGDEEDDCPVVQCDGDGKDEQGNCESGWKSFKRENGEWCVKIFYNSSIFTPDAEASCQKHGATLSGFQNQQEALWVTTKAIEQFQPGNGTILIGLKRRQECLVSGLTANCTAWNSFEWTDKSTTGVDGMLWSHRKPDNWHQQSCVFLYASITGYARLPRGQYQSGTLDDNQCEYTGRAWQDAQGYVCGKRA